jgi:hypothetical protein
VSYSICAVCAISFLYSTLFLGSMFLIFFIAVYLVHVQEEQHVSFVCHADDFIAIRMLSLLFVCFQVCLCGAKCMLFVCFQVCLCGAKCMLEGCLCGAIRILSSMLVCLCGAKCMLSRMLVWCYSYTFKYACLVLSVCLKAAMRML